MPDPQDELELAGVQLWEADWLARLLQTLDSKNLDALEGFFKPDATARFGNQPPLKGLDEIKKVYKEVLPHFDSIKHEPTRVSIAPYHVYTTMKVSYVVAGDPSKQPITVPAAAVVHKPVGPKEEQMGEFEVFGDQGPVWERVREVTGKTVGKK